MTTSQRATVDPTDRNGEPEPVGDAASHPRRKGWMLWLAPLASIALVAWLVWRVSLEELLRAFGRLDWYVLIPLTGLLVLGLFFWEALCIRVLFSDFGHSLSYRAALRARGTAYLFSVFNYGAGQGALAWLLSRTMNASLARTLARCLVLVYVDLVVLLTLGLLGAMLADDPITIGVRVFCIVGLGSVIAATALARNLHGRFGERLRRGPCGPVLSGWSWNGRLFLTLCGMRTVNFSFGVFYVIVCLWFCGIDLDRIRLLSALPITALVDGLPISVSGLGTRETTMVLLLQPEDAASLLAFCLVWSTCIIFGRSLIAVAHLWTARLAPPQGAAES